MGVLFPTQDRFTMFNKDFGKAASDLISKDFPGKFDVEVATKNSNLDVTSTMKLASDGTFNGALKPTFKLCKCSTLEVVLCTQGAHSMKLVNKDSLVKNLKSSAAVSCKVAKNDPSKSTQSLTLNADYTFNKGTASVNFAFPSLGFVYSHDKIAAGAEAAFTFGNSTELAAATANFQFANPEYIFTASATTSGSANFNGSIKYFYKHSKFILGSQVHYSSVAKENEPSASADIVLAKTLSGGGVGKVLFGSNGTVGVSYKKEICDAT